MRDGLLEAMVGEIGEAGSQAGRLEEEQAKLLASVVRLDECVERLVGSMGQVQVRLERLEARRDEQDALWESLTEGQRKVLSEAEGVEGGRG